ncbi:BlaI/MecI/CopY family transcriptional regulator [Patescibacteria group bacterium]|nr:BlaI/MecI/CopY family transcriptional regulator [Patescibacteria group bacterium]
MSNLLSSLKKYGLSEQEAKIYLDLLQIIEAPVYTVSQRTGIPRTSVYTTLERLRQKGFVTSIRKNSVLHYTPESPQAFVSALEEKKKVISAVLPEMADLIDSAKILPTVKLYQGRKGYIKVRQEMLATFKKKKIKQILAISSPSDFIMFPKYFPIWVEARKKLGVGARILLRADAKADKHFQNNKTDLREVRYLPPEYQYKSTLNIYGDQMAIFSLQGKDFNSIIIDSTVITEMFRQFFNLTWLLLAEND